MGQQQCTARQRQRVPFRLTCQGATEGDDRSLENNKIRFVVPVTREGQAREGYCFWLGERSWRGMTTTRIGALPWPLAAHEFRRKGPLEPNNVDWSWHSDPAISDALNPSWQLQGAWTTICFLSVCSSILGARAFDFPCMSCLGPSSPGSLPRFYAAEATIPVLFGSFDRLI
jgi:hypothetical protein